jgi:hypothetical protein
MVAFAAGHCQIRVVQLDSGVDHAYLHPAPVAATVAAVEVTHAILEGQVDGREREGHRGRYLHAFLERPPVSQLREGVDPLDSSDARRDRQGDFSLRRGCPLGAFVPGEIGERHHEDILDRLPAATGRDRNLNRPGAPGPRGRFMFRKYHLDGGLVQDLRDDPEPRLDSAEQHDVVEGHLDELGSIVAHGIDDPHRGRRSSRGPGPRCSHRQPGQETPGRAGVTALLRRP